MKFRPCIDLHDGKVKQIIGSSIGGDALIENYISDNKPSWYVEKFRKDGLTGGHVIMLGPRNEEAVADALAAWPDGLQVGGGINPLNCKHLIDFGASHVIVTSYIFRDGYLDITHLKEMSKAVGKDRLVVDISCAKNGGNDGHKDGGNYFVKTDRWTKWTDFEINYENIKMLSDYCAEILVHAVEVEGKQKGIDCDLVKLLSEISTLPTTYAGGVRDINDILMIKELGKDKIDVTIGSALDIYGGKLSYDDVVSVFKK